MQLKEVKFDCRFFRGEIPCLPNKLRNKVCTCDEYQKIETKILIIFLLKNYLKHSSLERRRFFKKMDLRMSRRAQDIEKNKEKSYPKMAGFAGFQKKPKTKKTMAFPSANVPSTKC